ncbi:BMC domain-containing protein [Entomomonas asaccharolytica]|uniref:BMC domain-containing protein n=1 Tax=Entomomonas asaccharolytica TaxID=2785331 RepID=A0A974NHN6_9GAMM|nr:BMC domain-containing protein [Entomomonas asaccharolytica]QQP86727.1 BMC domain-containing protein [Entomomonas asaccharolytica]
MINALGLLEVSGLTASIEAADAMLKAAQVRLISQTITPPGMITLVIEGDLAACRAALDAGSAAASRLGQVIVRKEIGRPETDTEWFVLNFQQAPKADKEPQASTAKPIAPEKVKSAKEVAVANTTPKAAPEKAAKPVVATTTQVKVTKPDEINEVTLIELIAKHPQGRNLTDLMNHFNVSKAEITALLKNCVGEGKLRRKGNRYYIIEAKK